MQPLASRQPILSTAFAVGVSVLAFAFALGAYQSVVVDRQLPRLGLNYNWWFRLLEERGDRDRIVEQWSMVAALDFGSRTAALGKLGDALRGQGQLDDAIVHYRRALAANPGSAQVHNNLASALAERGDTTDAIEHLRAALRIAPGMAAAQENLETLLAHREERLLLARQELTRLRYELEGRPNDWELRNDLAWLLATHSIEAARAPREALELAEEVTRATERRDASVLDTLAAAYAAMQRFDLAVAAATEARALALASGENDLVAEIDRHLERFRRGEPIVSAPSGSAG